MNTKIFSITDLIKDLKSGLINRDAEMQRSFVWTNKDQTELIDSIFQNATTYIPPLIGAESDKKIEIQGKPEKIISLLDGNQRSTTIEKFIGNELRLGNNIRPVIIEHEDETSKTYIIAGLKWSEIPEEAKGIFRGYKVEMVFFENMSLEDQERQFIKLQGGKKLTNAEVNKVRIGQEPRGFIYKQLASDLWSKGTNISNNREVKFEAMQQVLMVMTNQFEISGKSLQAFSENCNIPEATLGHVEMITEYIGKAANIIKKSILDPELQVLEESEIIEKLKPRPRKKYLKPIDYFKKVNMPIIYNTAIKAIDNEIRPEQFAEFISNFFADVPNDYKELTRKDCAASASVKGKIEIMDKAFVNEFSELIDELEDEDLEDLENDENDEEEDEEDQNDE